MDRGLLGVLICQTGMLLCFGVVNGTDPVFLTVIACTVIGIMVHSAVAHHRFSVQHLGAPGE